MTTPTVNSSVQAESILTKSSTSGSAKSEVDANDMTSEACLSSIAPPIDMSFRPTR